MIRDELRRVQELLESPTKSAAIEPATIEVRETFVITERSFWRTAKPLSRGLVCLLVSRRSVL